MYYEVVDVQMVKEEVHKVKAEVLKLEAGGGGKMLAWVWYILWEQVVEHATKQTWI
jgi:hypothetical protein